MPTRDIDIRAALRAGELARHRDDDDTIIVEEMGIYQGDFRIDIAVVNGRMTGYEIKSDKDTHTSMVGGSVRRPRCSKLTGTHTDPPCHAQ
jgi:hypothetical protein